MGSSPRVWGQVYNAFSIRSYFRIIPTRVGTRLQWRSARITPTDHPHACGDKELVLCAILPYKGSSPRVWGQGFQKSCDFRSHRIIPTRVGTSCHFYPNHGQGKDHPHACGDKRKRTMNARDKLGSSPRVWGQVVFLLSYRCADRIIPTRVGTRTDECDMLTFKQDHPHACGDKSVTSRNGFCKRGSSPRVWGQGTLSTSSASNTGIIPTRVGTRLMTQRI